MERGNEIKNAVLPMIGVYAEAGHQELEGTREDLLSLATALNNANSVHIYELRIPAEISPEPYDHFIRKMSILRTDGMVRIKLQGDLLEITGSTENLKALAKNVEVLASYEVTSMPRQHLHIEYYPDHFYLASDSEPLVISLDE